MKRGSRAALCMLALALLVGGAAQAGEITLFYMEPCTPCDDGSELAQALALLDGLYDPHALPVRAVNAFGGRAELDSAARARGLSASALHLPAAFLPDGGVLAGEDALTGGLRGRYAALLCPAWRGPVAGAAVALAMNALTGGGERIDFLTRMGDNVNKR